VQNFKTILKNQLNFMIILMLNKYRKMILKLKLKTRKGKNCKDNYLINLN